MALAKPIDCDELGLTIAQLAFDYARSGVRGIENVLKAIHRDVPELAGALSREQLVDNIVGFQQAQKKKVQTQAQKDLASLKSEAKSDRTAREAIDRMEKVVKGMPAEAVTPKQRRAVRKSLQQLNEIKRAMERQIRAKERIAEVEGRLKRGDVKTKPKAQGPKEELIARRDELNRQMQQVRNNQKRAEAIKEEIESLNRQIESGEFEVKTPKQQRKTDPELARLRKIARLTQKNIDLARQLETGRIKMPATKVKAPVDDTIDRLMFEGETLKAEINQRIRDAQPLTMGQKALEPFNMARAILTSMDLSALLRQGGFIAFGHPGIAAKSLGTGLRSLASHIPLLRRVADPDYVRKLQRDMTTGDKARYRERAGLHISRIEGQLAAQEEAVATNLIQRLANKKVSIKNFPFVLGAKAVQASQEAYTVMLNKIRVDAFDAMVDGLASKGAVTEAEAKAIANYINVATGRPKFNHNLERAANTLNAIFFAPRYALSRFQLLAGQPIWKGAFDKETPSARRARKLILKEYARYAVGLMTVLGLGLIAGGKLGTNPRSSEFGKLRFGNSRLDFGSGLLQPFVLMSRMGTGETAGPGGKERKSGVYPLVSFVRYKLSPLSSTIVDLLARTNAIGENTDITTADGRERMLTRLVVPISFGEAADAIAEQGVPKGTVFAILNMLGVGSQTYEAKK